MSSDSFLQIFPSGFTSVGAPGTIIITSAQTITPKPAAATKLLLKLTGNLGNLPPLIVPSVSRGGSFTQPALYWSVDTGTSPLGADIAVVNGNGTFALPNFTGFRVDNIGTQSFVFETRSPIQFVSGTYSIGLDSSGLQNTTYTLVGVEVRFQWGV